MNIWGTEVMEPHTQLDMKIEKLKKFVVRIHRMNWKIPI